MMLIIRINVGCAFKDVDKLDKKKTKLKKEKKKHRILQNDEKLASKSIKEVSDDSD